MVTLVKKKRKIVFDSDSDQVRWTEENSAMIKNVAEATEVLNLNLAQVIELNKMTQKIEPFGLLDL